VKCIPPAPWMIPDRELEVRRDFRDERVFTIDPAGAKDLDDALHVKKLDDGSYEVGVHIADVTHFVKPNTALDREAKKRATTVYLVQRAVPMFPPVVSESLCSLTPDEDKLTFSAVFNLTPEAKTISTWLGKTIIRQVAPIGVLVPRWIHCADHPFWIQVICEACLRGCSRNHCGKETSSARQCWEWHGCCWHRRRC
jgi:protein SSD1